MNRRSGILIGILAGIAAGLMAVAALGAGTAALVMMFAAPVAVYIASLGWGTTAGLIAAVIGSAASTLAGNANGAIIVGALLFVPAAWAGHLANLGQRDAGGGMLWYPLDRILIRLMAAVAAGIIVAGIVLGYNTASLETTLLEMLRELIRSGGDGGQIDEEALARNARLYAGFIPLVVPAIWLCLHVAVFYISAVIAARSGRMARPRDDIPSAANLPFEAVGWPLAGIVGMMVAPSPLYEVAAVLAGTGIAGFSLIGLAELHLTSRGRPGRGLLLLAAYLLIVLFSLPILIFAVMGVMRAWRARARPPLPPSTTGGGPGSTS